MWVSCALISTLTIHFLHPSQHTLGFILLPQSHLLLVVYTAIPTLFRVFLFGRKYTHTHGIPSEESLIADVFVSYGLRSANVQKARGETIKFIVEMLRWCNTSPHSAKGSFFCFPKVCAGGRRQRSLMARNKIGNSYNTTAQTWPNETPRRFFGICLAVRPRKYFKFHWLGMCNYSLWLIDDDEKREKGLISEIWCLWKYSELLFWRPYLPATL